MPKKRSCDTADTRPERLPAYHHLHAMLQTIRQLASHEDEICALLTELQHTPSLTAGMRRELEALLGELPLRTLAAEAEQVSLSLQKKAA